jgi:3-oxoacyl-[acyl-carrier protein] reductase
LTMRILVTGGSGGIGKSIIDELDCDVVSPSSKELNLTDSFAIDGVFDGLIHCAGVNFVKPYNQIDPEELSKLFQVNTFSFLNLCSHVEFNRGANIIAVGSLYATHTKEGRIQYSMSKHALLGAVKTLALEMSNEDIKVNMVSPGFVETKMTFENNSKDRINSLDEYIPLGMTKPKDIAKMCSFIVNNNQSMTGQNIIIDGGYSLRNF